MSEVIRTKNFVADAAEFILRHARKALEEREEFRIALSGGNTPRPVYREVARLGHDLPWGKVVFTFGDERCVPPEHPDSNYAMVNDAFMSRVPIPANNVHRIIGEGNASEHALAYENELRAFFSGLPWPRFDLILLGMGEDGHTASIFPNSAALREMSRWVVSTRNYQSDQDRITLTVPVFNHASRIALLVTGRKKAQRLKEVLRPEAGSEQLQVQAITPIDGMLEWLVDSDAASLL